MIVQLLTSFTGALGFCLVFHLRRRYMFAASLGGLLTCGVYLAGCGRKLAEISIPAVMGQRAAGAAESDTDSAGIAVPRMAFKLGELRAGLVNTAVGVDIEMVVVVKLAVTPGGPVQIDLRDAVVSQGDKFGELGCCQQRC